MTGDRQSPDIFTQLYVGRRVDSVRSSLDDIRREMASVEEQMDRIETTLRQVHAAAGDAALRQMRQGFASLGSARRAAHEQNRQAELQNARSLFGSLASYDPQQAVPTAKGEIDGRVLVALGLYGSFLCFVDQGEDVNAALEAYRCTVMVPGVGAQLFPEELFDRPYRQLYSIASQEYTDALNGLQAAQAARRAGIAKRALWRLGGAASALGGLAAASVYPPLILPGYAGARQAFSKADEITDGPAVGAARTSLEKAVDDLKKLDIGLRAWCTRALELAGE